MSLVFGDKNNITACKTPVHAGRDICITWHCSSPIPVCNVDEDGVLALQPAAARVYMCRLCSGGGVVVGVCIPPLVRTTFEQDVDAVRL